MALYRAKRMGTLPDGRRIREGEQFEFSGRKGEWMEPVEEEPAPAPSEPELEQVLMQAESAPEPVAESKRKGKRKETE